MSSKKDELAKQKRLAERQRLEKKKILVQITDEIQKLQYEIAHVKAKNTKIYLLRNLNISLRFMQMIAPYVLTASITFGIFAALGDIPFYRNDIKKKLETKKELDSLGSIHYYRQYNYFDNANATLTYTSKWYKGNDGLYARTIKTYSLDDISEETITKILSDMDNASLEDIFGSPIDVMQESKNNLTKEELNENDYLQAVMYDEDANDYIYVKQSTDNNILFTVLWIFLTAFAELVPAGIRQSSSFDFDTCVAKIKEKYPVVDVKMLKKKLEIKQDNYDRLTRQ